jgi:hypothetical protein
MNEVKRALRETEYNINKAASGKFEKLTFVDGNIIVNDRYISEKELRDFGNVRAADIFVLAANAKSEYEKLSERKPYPQETETQKIPYPQDIVNGNKDYYKRIVV